MPTTIAIHLGEANLGDTVLDNLKAGAPTQSFISGTLNTVLASSLATAATSAGYSELAALIGAIPPVDISASKDLSLHDFVSQQVKLPDDPTQKAAAEAAIAQLSTTTTVGDLLNLNSAIKDNPIFSGEVNKVDFANLLRTSPIVGANAQLIDDFVGLYANSSGALATFWQILSQNPEFTSVIPDLQFTLQLGTLTEDNPPLVSVLRSQHPNITTATQLASLTSAQWQQLISNPNVPVPATIQGSTQAEKVANYAASIIQTLTAALPGAYFVGDLQTAIANSTDIVDRGVTTFLANSSGFDILNTNLNTYLTQNAQTIFNGIEPTEQSAVVAKFATWQRLARVTPDFATANTLASAGFLSAYDIASTPKASFVQQLAGSTTIDAETLYGRAQRIAASAMTIYSNVRQSLAMPVVRGIGDVAGSVGTILGSLSPPTPPAGIPSWQTLFGSLSSCCCTDCRSVLSAAAYFVDLLQFLKKSNKNNQGYTPLDVLIGSADGKIPGRRPDLPFLKLNCENTNTTLPYIDLVNEILEGFVVINSGSLNSSVARNTPDSATASDLSVTPEYTNDQAYNQYLDSAVYPPTLPFDRWLTTARTYLGFLGSSLYQVENACQTGAVASDFTKGTPSGIALACESLNISRAECIILTGEDFSGGPVASLPPLNQYYGYSSTTAVTSVRITRSALSGNVATLTAINLFVPGQLVLIEGLTNASPLNGHTLTVLAASTTSFTASFKHADIASAADSGTATVNGSWEQNIAQVETFLQNTATCYADLVSLLQTRALNPNLTIMLLAPDDAPCDLTQTIIVDLAPTGPVIGNSTFNLMHRFIRLWKKLGWTIEDLDKTMTALQAKDIDQQLLVSLAAIGQLQATLNIPLTQILNFWNNLDTDGQDSLYLSLFQNQAVLNPPDPCLQLEYIAPLASPPTLEFPSPTFPNLSYDSTAHMLSMTGVMTADEFAALGALSADADYTAAISFLHVYGGLLKGLTVTLPALPPATLPNFLNYDPTKHQISFLGSMSDDQRAQLNFSSAPAYQTSVDALYEMRTLWGGEVAPPATCSTAISAHINQILAALRTSAQDLNLILTYTGLSSANLSAANLSALCRYAFLAQSLNLSISDLLYLIALVGVDPFRQQSPTATLSFVKIAQAVQSSPFSIAQLNYIYRQIYDPNAAIAPQAADVQLFLTTLQAGLASIANADVIVPDPNGTLLAANLAKLLGSTSANAAMGLINGTGIYTAPLAALPAIALPSIVTYNASAQTLIITGALTTTEQTQLLALSPDPTYQAAITSLYATSQLGGGVGIYTQALASLPGIAFPALPTGAIAYNSAAQQLQFTGPMTTADETTLLALSSDPAYQLAIRNLHQQPIDFINANFSNPNGIDFLNSSDAQTQLIENPAPLSTADKVLYVTRAFMPYLQQTQCESLIAQTLSDNLQMDPQLGSLLLKTILNSQVTPGAKAMADFLALVGDGLTSNYYPTIDLIGSPALKRIDPMVNFDWGFGVPDPSITAQPFSIEWTGWVMPQYSEPYTFYVRAGDGMRLWVNGQQIVNNWIDEMPVEVSGTISLTAGRLYTIKLDYYDHTAAAQISLSWSSPSTPKAIIPRSQLFSGAVMTSLANIVNSYTLFYKTSLLADTFSLTTADVSYLYQHGQDFVGVDPTDPTNSSKFIAFDPNLLPLDPSKFTPAMFDQWERLNAVVNLRNGIPGGDTGLLNVFRSASSSTTTGSVSSAVTPFVLQATGWDSTGFGFLVGSTGFNLTDANFKNEIWLVRLQACMALVGQLGVSAQQLFTWASFGPDAPTEESIANDVQNTVKSKYNDNTWVTVGKPLNDRIREASKEALIAYILAHSVAWNLTAPEGGAITTSEQLYEFFLIDVNMSACMLTSRIVQANAAVQLFVQRCLLNLESNPSNPATAVSPSVIDTTVWNWMQNYRVWQANREVFLYPETYMVPTLRDDMTPFFQDLINTLLQNPVTAESAERAYLTYLGQLDEVARLDIRGTYWQYDANSTTAPGNIPDGTNDLLHVFGRSHSQPYTYYYRTLQQCHAFRQGGGELWTPWEEVDLDVSGDHLVPVVWDGRLFLFWPIIEETADPTSQATMTIPPIHVVTAKEARNTKLKKPGPTEAPAPRPTKDLQITLAWSEYSQGAWSPKSTSDPMVFPDFSTNYQQPYKLDTSLFSFNSSLNGDSLVVTVNVLSQAFDRPSLPAAIPWQIVPFPIGTFTFSTCGSSPVDATFPIASWYVLNGRIACVPQHGWLSYNSVQQGGGNGLTLEVGSSAMIQKKSVPGRSFDVLGNTPENPWSLMFPQQFFCSYGLDVPSPFTDQPFFYQDSKRVYFVTENYSKPADQVADGTKASPAYARLSLTTIVPPIDAGIVFPTSSSPTTSGVVTPCAASASGTPATADSASASVASKHQSFPSQVVFTNFFHPFSCSFIKAVNQYGVPGFLTLVNQAMNNDNGVISGFISPYLVQTSAPTLSPGILITQNDKGNQFYQAQGDTNLGSAPPLVQSYLFYNSKKGFYYAKTTTPGTKGDAWLGEVNTILSWLPFGTAFTSSTAFALNYQPNSTSVNPDTYPRENVDFTTNGAYSAYNWELFFHIPLLIATSLSQNQQFSDAQTWFNYIFNPTSSSTDPIPQRYWNCLPFYECSPWDEIQGQIENILFPPSGQATSPPCLCGQSLKDQINQWKNNPFDPYLIGRMRAVAFRMNVVMAYLNNLIAWGDSLFTQNTRESINEATQIYMLANDILGKEVVEIPQRGTLQDYTYNDLMNFFGLDPFSNALVLIENDFPYLSGSTTSGSSALGSVISMSTSVPYFCVPPNATLQGYWTTVHDRLYKIRNCMNIQGQVQQLPLFAPPISPALLVAATAAGVDLSSVLSNTSAGPPFYRFKVVVNKALELCPPVQQLGAALLSALEKQDVEALELMQATQVTNLFKAMQQIKQSAVNAAQADVAALQASLQVVADRQQYYSTLIQNGLLASETQQLQSLGLSTNLLGSSRSALMGVSTGNLIPSVDVGTSGWGGSPYLSSTLYDSKAIIAIATALASSIGIKAAQDAAQANNLGVQSEFTRRLNEWIYQLRLATDERTPINSQISAAQFRLTMAQQDQSNLNLQIQYAQGVQNFLTNKYTNKQLYSWMVDTISTTYFQGYQALYDLATQAEAGFRFERGLTTSSYIQFGYWDSLKKGLLSGERLYADLKRMEIAYLESDLREYEISKSISLQLFDPWALIALKETGLCVVSLPEALFDMDYPGHYFRRLKSVSLSIPCVTGPYTSVNCTLTLLNSKLRVDNIASSKTDYASDAHFIANYAATQSIATSTAQNDSGLFEVDFSDERYLPFEGAGVISTWQIDLPPDCNAFDFESISDVVLNLRYTSRYGGDPLRGIARQAATMPIPPAQTTTSGTATPFPKQSDLRRLFSLKHEFPTEWYKFLNPAETATSQSMQIALGAERFPFQYRQKKIQISEVELFLLFKCAPFQSDYSSGNPLVVHLGPPGVAITPSITLTSSLSFLGGLAYGSIVQPPQPAASGSGSPPEWILSANSTDVANTNLRSPASGSGTNPAHLNPAAISDILVLCHYGVS